MSSQGQILGCVFAVAVVAVEVDTLVVVILAVLVVFVVAVVFSVCWCCPIAVCDVLLFWPFVVQSSFVHCNC